MKPVEIIFPLVAALWASGSLFFLATKERNDKRDRILSGYLEGRRMSSDHRLLLLKSDWLPLGLIVIGLSLTLAVISVCLPLLLPAHERPPAIWVVSGATFVLCARLLDGLAVERRAGLPVDEALHRRGHLLGRKPVRLIAIPAHPLCRHHGLSRVAVGDAEDAGRVGAASDAIARIPVRSIPYRQSPAFLESGARSPNSDNCR